LNQSAAVLGAPMEFSRSFLRGDGEPDDFDRARHVELEKALAKTGKKPWGRPTRKPPTLASVQKQADKAGIDVGRYEVKRDGTVIVVPGKPEASAPTNDLDKWIEKHNADEIEGN
jgi:hypothetical protein